MKILVVDDEPLFCELIKAELATCGYSDVRIVHSGVEALKLVRAEKEPFDCFLLDINMPGMDGIQLCSSLRLEPAATDAPFIMVTVRSELESVDKAFAAGATDYITKPISHRDLLGRMGMAAGMVRERAARKAAMATEDRHERFSFEDAVRLEADHSCLDYLAMQNYVLKLGSMRMFSHVVIGFRVANASELFSMLGDIEFKDVMSDVAEIIVEALRTSDAIVSYAGSGAFVALARRYPGVDTDDLFDQLQARLAALNGWYSNLGQIPVRLDVGSPYYRGLLSFLTPTEVLDEAVEGAWKPIFTAGVENERVAGGPKRIRAQVGGKRR
ncbi:response regulator [Ruegeria sediminis]|uniref:response regulator n=1 Tax=Ruegeria sediminis TaxID=2583820 RepID=UPI0014875398|nr:response regulator [Ruegeria sediminis]